MSLVGMASGAAKSLEEIVAARLQRQILEQEVADRQKRFQLDERRVNEASRQNDWERGRTERIDGEQSASRAKAEAREATERNGRSDMAAVLAMPGMTDEAKRNEIMGSGLRTGTVSPANVMDAIKPTPARLRAVTTPGPNGQPINRMVPETEAVEEYREPKAPRAPEKPTYIQVTQADGTLKLFTPEEIRASGGVATAKPQKPITGADRTTVGFFNRMLEAERNARRAEGNLTGIDLGSAEMAPDFLENWLRSPAGQQYAQAQRQYTEARLRKESGATAPPSEYENDRRTNFRIANDQPDTVKQKRASRIQTMRGMGNAAGRALQEFYGPDASLDSLLAEFADDFSVKAPDGKTYTFPTAEALAEFKAKAGIQ